ncbi:hypothetical protein MMC30_002217 [Trapelia coarctata]|nr:hypothetical protein [Trapelia coarctata]
MSLVSATLWRLSRPTPRPPLLRSEGLLARPATLHVSARRHQSQNLSSDRQPEEPVSKRIHVLGTGNIGSFIAHSFRLLLSPPPTTLLFHRPSLLEKWKSKAEMIEVVREGVSTFSDGFDVELTTPSTPPTAYARSDAAPEGIDNLIIAVKAPMTVAALHAIKDRITSQSTLLFLQNGMGVIEEVNKELFDNPSIRPNYLHGIITHGVNSTAPFTLTHAGLGSISLGPISPSPNSPSYIAQTLLRAAPVLNARTFSQPELLQLQWEKFVVNAIVNPLTALSNTLNGSILSPSLAPTIQLLVAEISAVIQALPEMPAEMKTRFQPERLKELVHGMAEATARNVSSMLQDVRAGRKTENEYITGYIVRRAEEVGVRCEENRRLMQAVMGVEGRGKR